MASISSPQVRIGEDVTIGFTRYATYNSKTLTIVNVRCLIGSSELLNVNVNVRLSGYAYVWTLPDSLIDIVQTTGTDVTVRLSYTFQNLHPAEYDEELHFTALPPAQAGPKVQDGWFSASKVDPTSGGPYPEETYVRYVSKMQILIDPQKVTPFYGSTVTGFRIGYNGSEIVAEQDASGKYKAVTPELSVNPSTVYVIAVDSRGNRTQEFVTTDIAEYSYPQLTDVSVFRSDASGTPVLSGTNIAAKATATCSLAELGNAVTLTAQTKAFGAADFGSPVTLTSGIRQIIYSPAPVTGTYIVRLKATDRYLKSVQTDYTVESDSVAFNLRDGGNGAAFGKYAQNANELEIPSGWSIRIGTTAINEAQLIALLNLL